MTNGRKVAMANIRVITDSASDLPASILESLGITSVPLEVRLDGVDPIEMANADAAEFWRLAGASKGLASTAAPSPGAFQQAFSAARDAGASGVCCVTISSDLSGTYQSACAAAREMPDFPINIVDSRFASMGEGLIAMEAAEIAASGASIEEVVGRTAKAIADSSLYGTLDTLEYLRRGGRIGNAQAFVGSLLSIKPVIELRNGIVEGESRQRTRTRSLRYLADKVSELGRLERFAIVHAGAQDLDDFLPMVADVGTHHDTVVTYIGPVIGAHTGPGTIGVCCQKA